MVCFQVGRGPPPSGDPSPSCQTYCFTNLYSRRLPFRALGIHYCDRSGNARVSYNCTRNQHTQAAACCRSTLPAVLEVSDETPAHSSRSARRTVEYSVNLEIDFYARERIGGVQGQRVPSVKHVGGRCPICFRAGLANSKFESADVIRDTEQASWDAGPNYTALSLPR